MTDRRGVIIGSHIQKLRKSQVQLGMSAEHEQAKLNSRGTNTGEAMTTREQTRTLLCTSDTYNEPDIFSKALLIVACGIFPTVLLYGYNYHKKWGIERLSSQLRVTQRVSGRARTWTWAIWAWNLCSQPLFSDFSVVFFVPSAVLKHTQGENSDPIRNSWVGSLPSGFSMRISLGEFQGCLILIISSWNRHGSLLHRIRELVSWRCKV